MQERLERLENKIQETRAKISRGTFESWLASRPTKVLLLQLDLDLEELKDNWANRRYSESNDSAQGQAEYIDGLKEVIKALGGPHNES